jgi:hypothetical protein
MSQAPQSTTFYIGWDVGGWNCDKNSKSRDAIVILDAHRAILGQPWRGNLRTLINEAANTGEWIRGLFSLCSAGQPLGRCRVTLAIDTPLGFSEAFVGLVTGLSDAGPVEASHTNPYLYRRTERYLFERGLAPLSAIKDMIGSQATKGMHVLARFAPHTQRCGVWTDGEMLTAIEAYPSACKNSSIIRELRTRMRLPISVTTTCTMPRPVRLSPISTSRQGTALRPRMNLFRCPKAGSGCRTT